MVLLFRFDAAVHTRVVPGKAKSLPRERKALERKTRRMAGSFAENARSLIPRRGANRQLREVGSSGLKCCGGVPP
jgi:hypothetical protein